MTQIIRLGSLKSINCKFYKFISIKFISLGHDTRVNNEKAGNMIHNSRLPYKKKIRERQTIRQKTTGQIRSIIMIKGFI